MTNAHPPSWTPWPPTDECFHEQARKALGAAQRFVTELAPDDDPVIEIWLTDPARTAGHWYAPHRPETTILIGVVIVEALSRMWGIYWAPETNTGRLSRLNDRKHDLENARRERTRIA